VKKLTYAEAVTMNVGWNVGWSTFERQGDFTQRIVYQSIILMFNEHLLYTSKRGQTKVQVGTMSPLPHYQKDALEELPTQTPKKRGSTENLIR
jgi:hypothetical protein